MPLTIIRNDITKVRVDAIVNTAAPSLLGGGGVDGAIHRAAGQELLFECRTLGGCEVGEAKITEGYRLPVKYVIHTVGPIWHDGQQNEERLLANCYKNSLVLAKEYQLESIAFPLISSGAFGYPKDKALRTAIITIGDFLLSHEMTVFLVVYDRDSFKISEKLFSSISQYIDDNYIEEQSSHRRFRREERLKSARNFLDGNEFLSMGPPKMIEEKRRSLDDIMEKMDKTFSERLLQWIDEKGMTDVETYKKANIDRKLFSKIRKDINYRPSKRTVIAFAIALKLELHETEDLLNRAGFTLSNSRKSDIIIHYFIERGNYNIFEINEALFAFDQNLLGV